MIVNHFSRRFCEGTVGAMNHFKLDGVTALREKCFENIRKMPTITPEKLLNKPKAAVLVALCEGSDGDIGLLYTLRASHLKSHAGHVSFPGGKFDETDGSMTATALRETEEELGIPSRAIEVWYEFPHSYPSKNFDIAVTPVVGMIRNFDKLKLTPNPSEVEEVFTVPLERLSDRQYFGFNEFKNGYTIPVFMGGKHKIWGLTSIVTHLFLSCLLPINVYPMQFENIQIPKNYSKSKV